ncbi:MAG TPA: glycosyltransferase family 1 protein [Pyrinomonadaceae bacterium]|nr:glycosyltransferase family 1 protein [Pyrinomonadaceae bacterium]
MIVKEQGLLTSTNLPASEKVDLICFSHLRWDFVFQRPQHLLTRCAKNRRVFFIEEPVYVNGSMRLDVRETESGVHVVVPQLPNGLQSEIAINAVMKEMTRQLFWEHEIEEYIFWYYTPMALRFTDHFKPIASVYDCMDELSAFKGAPSHLPALEKKLFRNVDLVFTGGQSLYEAKCNQHASVHAFPSSIDAKHFGKARTATRDPEDQSSIPHPRLGFFGVIDERFDSELLDQVATKRPDWNFVIIGPIVKIDPDSLPKHSNIHYLGPKKYEELPDYLAGWDIALLLFARNESTRFISPTKTPEYLAAGKPVISTSITDVVRPYGQLKLVEIADSADEFIQAAEKIFSGRAPSDWLTRVDAFLEGISWDKTWAQMSALIDQVIQKRRRARPAALPLDKVNHRANVAATT